MKKNGFTLIELLVVIFIIGILAAVLLPNFISSRERARDTRRKHDLSEIKTALRLYYNDHQSYPDTLSFGTNWSSYMQSVPDDSLEGRSYRYCVSSDGEQFLLFARLENPADKSLDSSTSRCGVSQGNWSGGSCDLSDCFSGNNNLCYYVCGN